MDLENLKMNCYARLKGLLKTLGIRRSGIYGFEPTPVLENLIRNIYLGILHREVDDEALWHWIRQIRNGLEFDRIVEQLLASEERKQNEAHDAECRWKAGEFDRTCEERKRIEAHYAECRWKAGEFDKLFVPPGHFYSPIVDLSEIEPLFSGKRNDVETSVRIDGNGHLRLWHEIVPLLEEIPFTDLRSDKRRYFYLNDAYSYGDAMLLYSMLRRFRPSRIIEVGSGYSSACTLDTVEAFLGNNAVCTFIEPYPHLLQSLLRPGDMDGIRIIPHRVQDVDVTVFEELSENDILLIDSTHVAKTGSDVIFELFSVLPHLKSGVVIQFHDMFYPFEYPKDWVLKENRSWNELYMMRAFLTHNDAYEVLFFTDYFGQKFSEEIRKTFPLLLEDRGCSLWLRKR